MKNKEDGVMDTVNDEVEGRRDFVVRELEELIANGQLAPGERLDERVLAERFKVSRTPVREALNRLASTGLVVNRGRQGAFVSAISVAELFQTFEAMSELEGLCAKLTAQRITEEEREQLRRFVVSFDFGDRPPPIDRYMQMNEQFHRMVYRGSHNPVLEDLANQIHRRVKSYRRYTLLANGRIKASAAEHHATADAICRGDAQKAYEAMQYHVDIRRLDHADFVTFLTRLNEQNKSFMK